MKLINEKIRRGLVISGLIIISSGIISVFWYNEWIYSLPTPVPENYHEVSPGEFIDLKMDLRFENRPVFLHFFNPDCPCSKFNIPHFRWLVKQYGSRISFAVVLMNKEGKKYTAKDVKDKLGLNVPVLINQSIAPACGVYSTPQAVILDSNHKLFYRWNYNKSRYCDDKRSAYAQSALESLLNNNHKPQFDELALKAYGCQLPNCNIK
jgi:hypothetical protein